jgi:hypothetical protein
LHPAHLNLPRKDPLVGSFCTTFRAMWRGTPMLCGPAVESIQVEAGKGALSSRKSPSAIPLMPSHALACSITFGHFQPRLHHMTAAGWLSAGTRQNIPDLATSYLRPTSNVTLTSRQRSGAKNVNLAVPSGAIAIAVNSPAARPSESNNEFQNPVC